MFQAIFGVRWDKSKFKTHMKLAVKRMSLVGNKGEAMRKAKEREVATLIKEGNIELARIQCETLLRLRDEKEVMEKLTVFCELGAARTALLDTSKEIPPDLDMPLSSVIFAAERFSQIDEFKVIARLLTAKFGKEMHARANANEDSCVDPSVVHRLTVSQPDPFLVSVMMRKVATQFKVPYEPDDLDEEARFEEAKRLAEASASGRAELDGGSGAAKMNPTHSGSSGSGRLSPASEAQKERIDALMAPTPSSKTSSSTPAAAESRESCDVANIDAAVGESSGGHTGSGRSVGVGTSPSPTGENDEENGGEEKKHQSCDFGAQVNFTSDGDCDGDGGSKGSKGKGVGNGGGGTPDVLFPMRASIDAGAPGETATEDTVPQPSAPPLQTPPPDVVGGGDPCDALGPGDIPEARGSRGSDAKSSDIRSLPEVSEDANPDYDDLAARFEALKNK